MVWEHELHTWLSLSPNDIQVVLHATDLLKRPITIVSYDMVGRLTKELQACRFGVLIADESHYLKSAMAKRTKEVKSLVRAAKHAVLITGTPALSRPMELFAQLSMLAPRIFKDPVTFGRRYCDGFQAAHGWNFDGESKRCEARVSTTRRTDKPVQSV